MKIKGVIESGRKKSREGMMKCSVVCIKNLYGGAIC